MKNERLSNQRLIMVINGSLSSLHWLICSNIPWIWSIVSGIILAGPAEMKNKLSEKNLINQYFSNSTQNLILIETSEISSTTIHEVYSKCMTIIDPIDDPIEKKIINEFNT